MLKGLSGLANVGSMLKQAQEMGSKMEGLNETLKNKRATGAAGGGMVEVEVTGTGEVLKVRIDPTLIERRDAEMIEDLLPAAFNQALERANALRAEAMQEMTSGMDLPGLDEALSKLSGQ